LKPRPDAPSLSAWRRHEIPASHARIAGSFLDLFDLIDGSLDGDALFFSRKLRVTGDTEAAVALRNALDDVEGGVVESITRAFGPLSPVAAMTVTYLRRLGGRGKHYD
jgi:predicted lipid carrier protein YhbT